jgi:ribosomal protein L20A (L18A)
MKQTAIDWLLQELTIADFEGQQIAIKQAKEIEKQQIKDAYITGMFNAHSKTSIDYYKETYETTM